LKIFRTTGWIETNFSQNTGTAHPLEQMRAKPWQPSLILGKVTGHNFGRGAFKKYHIKVWSNLTQWLLKRSKCKKLTDDRQQTQSDGKSPFQPSALVN
jgi:hypothetical protein